MSYLVKKSSHRCYLSFEISKSKFFAADNRCAFYDFVQTEKKNFSQAGEGRSNTPKRVQSYYTKQVEEDRTIYPLLPTVYPSFMTRWMTKTRVHTLKAWINMKNSSISAPFDQLNRHAVIKR